MSKMAKCLQEEEKLAVCVQGYCALYNKAEPYFHNKNEKQNTWGKFADDLQLGSWKEALAFTSLRSKYNRRKKNLKDCHRSGTSSDRVQKAEKDLNEYSFLFLLNSVIYERKGR